ncbi:MAG TPA: SRPBCC family protein [Candidatus Angelobacter sp.]|jgi:carbon monoxide dehydrogenase subunit G|nr:SRPBCC family protein [Candidatus Angelobacter sp.]
MVEARADVTLPVPPAEAFAAATDLRHADWLPAVRGLRHIGGPEVGLDAQYEVEVGIIGRNLHGVLICTESAAPTRAVFSLEQGRRLDLSIIIQVRAVRGGCKLEVTAKYAVGGGPFGGAVEKASAGAARHEVARAVENLAARLGRKSLAG